MVVVLFNAGPLDITWADGNPEVTSILECFFPAQEAGAALLQVVQGEASPAGRLPFTWYRAANQVASCLIVCYLNKDMYNFHGYTMALHDDPSTESYQTYDHESGPAEVRFKSWGRFQKANFHISQHL